VTTSQGAQHGSPDEQQGGRMMTAATEWGWPSRERLVQSTVGLYLDVTQPDGEAGAGWVTEVFVEGDTLWLQFDWGYAVRIGSDTVLTKCDPTFPPFTFAEALS
jgi:hypothetical protein